MVAHSPQTPLQQLFRQLLTAMSSPGQFVSVKMTDDSDQPWALLLQTAQCLLDHEVSFAVVGSDLAGLAEDICRRTGSSFAGLDAADYIFVQGNHSHGAILQAKRGTSYYPDLSATVIFQIRDHGEAGKNEDGQAERTAPVVLSGPGIPAPFSPPYPGLATEEYRLLMKINAEYPLGVDTIIIDGNHRVMAIPRSTKIKVR